MLGGMISDLEVGDEFEPVRYTVTSLMTAEYAHGVEETGEWFLSDDNPLGRQVRIPLMIHADKMRLLEVNCPKEARLSGARSGRPLPLRVPCPPSQPYLRRRGVGRQRPHSRVVHQARPYYLHYQFEVHTADGRLVTEHRSHLAQISPGGPIVTAVLDLQVGSVIQGREVVVTPERVQSYGDGMRRCGDAFLTSMKDEGSA